MEQTSVIKHREMRFKNDWRKSLESEDNLSFYLNGRYIKLKLTDIKLWNVFTFVEMWWIHLELWPFCRGGGPASVAGSWGYGTLRQWYPAYSAWALLECPSSCWPTPPPEHLRTVSPTWSTQRYNHLAKYILS